MLSRTPKGAVRLETDVGSLLIAADDTVMRPLIAQTGDWEIDEAMLFRAHLHEGMTVVDVGAHVGYYTLLAARAVGRAGRVVAVEPHPFNAELLRANVARNKLRNVQVVEAAAWCDAGELELRSSPELNTGDHRIVRAGDGDTRKVPAVTVDQVLGDAPVHVVKIDAQGTDQLVIDGMARALARCRPVIFVEYWPEGIREFGDDPVEVVASYRALGFRLTMPGLFLDHLSAPEIAAVVEQLPTGYGTLVLRPPRAP